MVRLLPMQRAHIEEMTKKHQENRACNAVKGRELVKMLISRPSQSVAHASEGAARMAAAKVQDKLNSKEMQHKLKNQKVLDLKKHLVNMKLILSSGATSQGAEEVAEYYESAGL
jgi:hypothetical protein